MKPEAGSAQSETCFAIDQYTNDKNPLSPAAIVDLFFYEPQAKLLRNDDNIGGFVMNLAFY